MPTVLVVDDAAVDRKLAGGLLERSPNLQVSYAENGNDALSQIKHQAPDLVLTDLQMPDIDGLQLVTSIGQDHPNIPVVLMTAHGSEVVAAQALANGAASETFVDYAGRKAFDNYNEYEALFDAERTIPEMPRPRISAQRLIPEHIKTRLGVGGETRVSMKDVA